MSNLLVPVILLISSIGLFFTYVLPSYNMLNILQAQEQRVDEAISKFGVVMKKKEDLILRYASFTQADRDKLSLVLPTDIDVVQIVMILDKLAMNNKLTVQSFGIPDSTGANATRRASNTEPPEIGTATFRIEIIGTYENIKNFLYQVERSATIFDVTEFHVETYDNKKDEGVPSDALALSIALTTYWLY